MKKMNVYLLIAMPIVLSGCLSFSSEGQPVKEKEVIVIPESSDKKVKVVPQ